MKILDQRWDEVERALRVGVKLLSSFGFSESTLPAASVLIPVADYIHQRNLDEGYVTSASPTVRADRELVRHWTIRTILKPRIWGSGLDGLLRALHQVIKRSDGPFPMQAIESEMSKRGKSLAFDAELIDELVDTPYRHKRTFALLSLLYDWVDTRNDFHVDHVFPRSVVTKAQMRDHGVDAGDLEEFVDKVELLGNLQLLSGPENMQKRAQLPGDWIRSHVQDEDARRAWLVGHDLHGLPADLSDFLPFYEQRRTLMRSRLVGLLGTRPEDITGRAVQAPSLAPLPASDAMPPPVAVAQHRTAAADAETGTRRHHRVRMADLLHAGLLPVGARLHQTHRGTEYEVTLRADGRLDAGGESFDTPSQAARLLTRQKAVNGWAFWLT